MKAIEESAKLKRHSYIGSNMSVSLMSSEENENV